MGQIQTVKYCRIWNLKDFLLVRVKLARKFYIAIIYFLFEILSYRSHMPRTLPKYTSFEPRKQFRYRLLQISPIQSLLKMQICSVASCRLCNYRKCRKELDSTRNSSNDTEFSSSWKFISNN